jgi:hypothetical protein
VPEDPVAEAPLWSVLLPLVEEKRSSHSLYRLRRGENLLMSSLAWRSAVSHAVPLDTTELCLAEATGATSSVDERLLKIFLPWRIN